MMKKYYFALFIVLGLTLNCLMGCSDDTQDYINYSDSSLPAPAQVLNPASTSIPGGAYITYQIPKDKNLRYVKAVYETQPGKQYEVKSSIYSDTIKVEGYGDTEPHDV